MVSGPPLDIPMPPVTAARLLFFVHADRLMCTLLYSALALLVWDHLLTLRREARFIWRAKWTVIKTLFLFNRYITLIIITGNAIIGSGVVKSLTNTFCQRWILIGATLELFCISFVSFVVLFRLHAMWGGSREMFVGLLFMWFLSFLGSATIFLRIFFYARRFIFHDYNFNICFAVIPNIWLLWLPDALLHLFLLILILWKAIATPRSSRTPLHALLYRDGIAYYSSTLLVMLLGMALWKWGDVAWVGVPLYVGWVVIQIAMSRLLLSLRTVSAFETQQELEMARARVCQYQHHGFGSRACSRQTCRSSSRPFSKQTRWHHTKGTTMSARDTRTKSHIHTRTLSSPVLTTVSVDSHCSYQLDTFAVHGRATGGNHGQVESPYGYRGRSGTDWRASIVVSYDDGATLVPFPSRDLEEIAGSNGTTPSTTKSYSGPTNFHHTISRDGSDRGRKTPNSASSMFAPDAMSTRKAEMEHETRTRTRLGDYDVNARRPLERLCRLWWWLFTPSHPSFDDITEEADHESGDEETRADRRDERCYWGRRRMRQRDARISVDASDVEWWDPADGDPGPGVKDSRLGRYDHWL